MSTDNPPESGSSSPSDETIFNLELILLGYVDRINRGGRVDPEEIYADHPDVAGEILEQLEAFHNVDCEFRPDLPLGTLGDYTLRRQIGRGGMGVVYEAWENSMDRPVALKVLPVGVAADERSLHRFVREAKTAGKLSHPNVVSVYGMGLKEQTPYYAMELVEGETLARVLARIKDAEADTETPFGPKDQVDCFAKLARAFADVADGLQHAHSKGVIHRDVKPSNLILDSEGRLRILDFGLARLEGQESLTISGDFVEEITEGDADDVNADEIPDECQPPHHLAPPFLRGDSNADAKVNIADGVSTLGFLFAGDQVLPCLDAADTDDSGQVDIADAIGTFNWLFGHGAAPASPGPQDCGKDPTPDDALDCAVFTACPR